MKEKTKGAQLHLFQTLFAHFCRLNLSHNTDKPFAISGLEQRLTQRIEDTSGAGIFGRNKGRFLLWRRDDGVQSLERIVFNATKSKAHTPPSWSFMAHVGGITYINIPGHTVNWEELDLRLTGSGSTSWLYAEEPLLFRALARDFEVKTEDYSEQSMLVYDRPAEDRNNDRCVIIGTVGDKFRYVLVVRPRGENGAEGSQRPLYERTGAGYIPISWIKDGGIDTEII